MEQPKQTSFSGLRALQMWLRGNCATLVGPTVGPKLQRSEIFQEAATGMSSSELPGSRVHEQDFRGLPGEKNANMHDSTCPSVVFTPDENIFSTFVLFLLGGGGCDIPLAAFIPTPRK